MKTKKRIKRKQISRVKVSTNYSTLWINIKKDRYKRKKKVVPKMFLRKKEKYFLERVVAYYKRHGWRAHHHDTRNSPRYAWIIGPGFPDLVLVKKVKGRTKVIWAELKLEKGYPTKSTEGMA